MPINVNLDDPIEVRAFLESFFTEHDLRSISTYERLKSILEQSPKRVVDHKELNEYLLTKWDNTDPDVLFKT